MKNKILALILAMSLIFVFVGCGEKSDNGNTDGENNDDSVVLEYVLPYDFEGTHTAVITVEDFGEIKVILDETKAPITVANFVKLANKGFYDGLTFHRIINGFMIQGGDPKADGTGGSDETIKGEFAVNGFNNVISHKRGVISMARGGYSYDSASSQFFIMHMDNAGLDGQYAAFGYVVKGMDVVDKIAAYTPVVDDNGTVLKDYQPVIESIKILK